MTVVFMLIVSTVFADKLEVCRGTNTFSEWGVVGMITDESPKVPTAYGKSMDSFGLYLVVGAPAEENGNGAVYIYRRVADSSKLILYLQYIQKT